MSETIDQLTHEGKPIDAIEYHLEGRKWVPHSVTVDSSYYDFNWCEVDKQSCYHKSGGGGKFQFNFSSYSNAPKLCSKVWLSPRLARVSYNAPGCPTVEEVLALGTLIVDEPIELEPGVTNPFAFGMESRVEYCYECKCHHPEDNPCRHLQLMDSEGYSLGCGASELDLAETRSSFMRLLELLPRAAVKTLLRCACSTKWRTQTMDSMFGGDFHLTISDRKGSIRLSLESLGDEALYEVRYWPGVAWLLSLDKSTVGARAAAAGWCYEFLRENQSSDHTLHLRLSKRRLDEWLALDPHDPSDVSGRVFVLRMPLKVQSANEIRFNKNPHSVKRVVLWPKDEAPRDERVVEISVAAVDAVSRGRVTITPGRIVEFKGRHISEIEGYDLCTVS